METVVPPGVAVTMYPVMGEPPVDTGGAQVTTAWDEPADADTPVGAPGTDVDPGGATV